MKKFAIALYEATRNLSGKDLEGVLSSFVNLLNEKHKLKSADKIIAEFIKYAKKQEGIMDITISSARELDNKVIEEIKKIFGKQTESVENIDENLLGGVVIKTDDVIFDGSIKTQLVKLKNCFI
jgi:F-type H+-transporting ATPase subunit delta